MPYKIMLTRRQFLGTATTTLLLIPIVAACSSDSSSPDAAPTCEGVDTTSTVNAAHTHTVCVLTTDLTNPPAAGAAYTTSFDGGHSHTLALTQTQLTMIEAGTAVTATCSSVVDPINNTPHTHDFMIVKA
jgi:hypothetical protein